MPKGHDGQTGRPGLQGGTPSANKLLILEQPAPWMAFGVTLDAAGPGCTWTSAAVTPLPAPAGLAPAVCRGHQPAPCIAYPAPSLPPTHLVPATCSWKEAGRQRCLRPAARLVCGKWVALVWGLQQPPRCYLKGGRGPHRPVEAPHPGSWRWDLGSPVPPASPSLRLNMKPVPWHLRPLCPPCLASRRPQVSGLPFCPSSLPPARGTSPAQH